MSIYLWIIIWYAVGVITMTLAFIESGDDLTIQYLFIILFASIAGFILPIAWILFVIDFDTVIIHRKHKE